MNASQLALQELQNSIQNLNKIEKRMKEFLLVIPDRIKVPPSVYFSKNCGTCQWAFQEPGKYCLDCVSVDFYSDNGFQSESCKIRLKDFEDIYFSKLDSGVLESLFTAVEKVIEKQNNFDVVSKSIYSRDFEL